MSKYILLSIQLLFLSQITAQNKTENYIIRYKQLAIDEMLKYKIPASIILAQGILESGNGESRLAIEANNHFGIKCHSSWNGESINKDDDKKDECFRKYLKVADSYRDHSLFLVERERYAFLFTYRLKDYKRWAKGLKKAGYATNPKYSNLIIDLIEKYNLDKYDKPLNKNRLYFAYSYGLPYISGIGLYYSNNNSLYLTEINTSFIFSDFNLGYRYEIYDNIYSGINIGISYLPTESIKIIPQASGEIIYKLDRISPLLIRLGFQLPLQEVDLFSNNIEIAPYFRLTYLIN